MLFLTTGMILNWIRKCMIGCTCTYRAGANESLAQYRRYTNTFKTVVNSFASYFFNHLFMITNYPKISKKKKKNYPKIRSFFFKNKKLFLFFLNKLIQILKGLFNYDVKWCNLFTAIPR